MTKVLVPVGSPDLPVEEEEEVLSDKVLVRVTDAAETSPRRMYRSILHGFNRVALSPEEGVSAMVRLFGLPAGTPVRDFLEKGFEPETATERILSRGGEDMAFTLAGGGVMNVAAKRSGLVASQRVARGLPPIPGMIQPSKTAQGEIANLLSNPTTADRVRAQVIGSIQKNPIMVNALEAISGFTGGMGAQGAAELGGGTLAQTGGGVAGGFAPGLLALTPAALMVRTLRQGLPTVKTVATKQGRQAAAFEEARQLLAKELDETSSVSLARANAVFEDLGVPKDVFRPSIAEGTRSPNLLATQRMVERRASGSQINTIVTRKEAGTQAVLHNQHRPEITGHEAEVVYDAARNRVIGVQQRIADDQLSNTQKQQQLTDRLEGTNQQAVGRDLRSEAATRRSNMQQQFNEIADDIGLNDLGVSFDASGLHGVTSNKFFNEASIYASGKKPKVIRDFLKINQNKIKEQRAIGVPDDQLTIDMSLGDIQALRTRVNDELSVAAQGAQRNPSLERDLVRFQKDLDDWFEKLDPVPNAQHPKLQEDWRAFRQLYSKEFINRFDRGAAFQLRRKTGRGEYQVKDERIADAFTGSQQNMQEFKMLFGNSDSAMVGLRAAILDKVRLQPGIIDLDKGIINQRALDKWLTKNEAWLNEVPAVQRELSDLNGAQKALAARESMLRHRSQIVDREVLGSQMGVDPVDMTKRALRDERAAVFMRNSAKRAGKEQALNGLIWEQAMNQLGFDQNTLPDPEGLVRWMVQHDNTLSILLPQKHRKALQNVWNALEMITITGLPTGQAEPVGPAARLAEAVGISIPSAVNRGYAMQTGRVQKEWLVSEAFIKVFDKMSNKQKQAILFETLYDPDVAIEMSRAIREPKYVQKNPRKVNGWLYITGVPHAIRDLSLFENQLPELPEE